MLDKGLVKWMNANLTKEQLNALNIFYNGIMETCRELGTSDEETVRVANNLMWNKVKNVQVKRNVG